MRESTDGYSVNLSRRCVVISDARRVHRHVTGLNYLTAYIFRNYVYLLADARNDMHIFACAAPQFVKRSQRYLNKLRAKYDGVTRALYFRDINLSAGEIWA